MVADSSMHRRDQGRTRMRPFSKRKVIDLGRLWQ